MIACCVARELSFHAHLQAGLNVKGKQWVMYATQRSRVVWQVDVRGACARWGRVERKALEQYGMGAGIPCEGVLYEAVFGLSSDLSQQLALAM